LLALIGDLASTALMAALPVAGGTWRTAYALIAAVMLAWSIGLVTAAAAPPAPAPAPTPEAGGDDDDAPHDDDDTAPTPLGLWRALREALADRTLILWLFATALCDLLDEILVVFASIHLRDDLGASPLAQSLAIAAMLAGGAVGLVALDRVLARRGERAVLTACAIACAITYAAWLAAPTAWLSALLLVPVGATATPLYPLAQARAYARRPGASGAVQAASHLFTPLGLALPFAIGVIADHAGTTVALAVLLVQPLGLAVLAAADRAP
jgi:Major Facilitator Superfamily